MSHEDFIKKLQEGQKTYQEEIGADLHIEKIKFKEDFRAGKKILTAFGIFGPETTGSDGYVDEIIHPEEGGTLMKIYGCKFLYRGVTDGDIVQGVQMAKALFSDFTIRFVKMPMIAFGFLFSYVFQRETFMLNVDFALKQIEERVLKFYQIKNYNPFPKEIKRVISKSLEGIKTPCIENIVRRIGDFFALVIEIDPAYRFRLQDAIGEAYKRGNMTVFSILDVLIERETPLGIARKWQWVRNILKIVMAVNKDARVIINRAVAELDVSKIVMDSNDWYFCLRYKSYNFRGKTETERLLIREELDKLNGNTYLV